MAEFDGLDPTFAAELSRLFAAAPGHIGITSGFRDGAEQAALYAKDPSMAAKPGSSWHEFGLAADLNWADATTLQWMHDHAAEYGLFFPMGYEPWHIQPLWTQGRKASAASASAADSMSPPPPDAPKQQNLPGSGLGAFTSLLLAPSDVNDKHPVDSGPDGANWGGTMAAERNTEKTDAGVGSYSMAYQLAVNAGATPEEAKILAAIAGAESSYNPAAVSKPNDDGSIDRGLWQINSVHSQYDPNQLVSDPAYNAKAAVEILRSQGFSAWTVYNTGAYKDYLVDQAPNLL